MHNLELWRRPDLAPGYRKHRLPPPARLAIEAAAAKISDDRRDDLPWSISRPFRKSRR